MLRQVVHPRTCQQQLGGQWQFRWQADHKIAVQLRVASVLRRLNGIGPLLDAIEATSYDLESDHFVCPPAVAMHLSGTGAKNIHATAIRRALSGGLPFGAAVDITV